MSVTPVVAPVTEITSGGTAQIVIPTNPNGGFITNPAEATASLFVDPTGADATLSANGSTFEILPGQTWTVIPGQTSTTSVNAPDNNHQFSAIYF